MLVNRLAGYRLLTRAGFSLVGAYSFSAGCEGVLTFGGMREGGCPVGRVVDAADDVDPTQVVQVSLLRDGGRGVAHEDHLAES